ncbi:MAG: SDR family NAD(P)-dependent oxidoreductase [Micropruina sp.]
MTGPLAGRTVLVTGGSRGIGRAIVRAAHRDGATVVLHYASSATRIGPGGGRRARRPGAPGAGRPLPARRG